MNAQLTVDAEHVRLDRIAAYDQALLNICRISTSGKQNQNVRFTRREAMGPGNRLASPFPPSALIVLFRLPGTQIRCDPNALRTKPVYRHDNDNGHAENDDNHRVLRHESGVVYEQSHAVPGGEAHDEYNEDAGA